MPPYKATAVITGGTAGLGYHAALNIARERPDWQVVIASRSDRDLSAHAINKATNQTNTVYLPLDLGDLQNVRSFASDYSDRDFPPIHALLLNAGLQFWGNVGYTPDGIEKTFAINHVGHVLLFNLLRPHFAQQIRIVLTSSGTHDPAEKTGMPDAIYRNAEELAHPTAETAKYEGRQRYGTSKLTNILWTYALHRRIVAAGKQWTVVAIDPGLMPGTGLAREYPAVLQWIWNQLLPRMIPLLRLLLSPNIYTVADSGEILAATAIGDEVKGKSGVYLQRLKVTKSSDASHEEPKQDDLWEWTAQAVANNENEARAFKNI